MAKKKASTKKPNPAKKKTASAALSPKAFGELVGVTRERIMQTIVSGLLIDSVKIIPYGSRKKYLIDPVAGKKEWESKIDKSKQRAPQEDNLNSSAFQKSKAAKEFYTAQTAKLDYEVKAGKLLSAEKTKAQMFKIGRRLRDTILAVPDRVSAELAGMDDPRQINIYLKEQLAEALKDLGELNDTERLRP